MRKALSLVLAAFLAVGAVHTARAADEEVDDLDYASSYMDMIDEDDDEPAGPRLHWGGPGRPVPPPRFMDHDRGPGHRRHDMRHDGPGRRGGPDFGPRGMMGMKAPKGMKEMRRYFDLDLTDAQKKQIIDVMTDNYRDTLEARFAIMDARKGMEAVYEQDSPDERAIVSAHEAMGAATGRMAALKHGLQDKLSGILTPEQRERLDAPRRDRPGKFGRPDRGPKGGPKDGPRDGGPKRK